MRMRVFLRSATAALPRLPRLSPQPRRDLEAAGPATDDQHSVHRNFLALPGLGNRAVVHHQSHRGFPETAFACTRAVACPASAISLFMIDSRLRPPAFSRLIRG